MNVQERITRLRSFYDCLTVSTPVVDVRCAFDFDCFIVIVRCPCDWESLAPSGVVYRSEDFWCATLGTGTTLDDALCIAEEAMVRDLDAFLRGERDPDQVHDLLLVVAGLASVNAASARASGTDRPLMIRSR